MTKLLKPVRREVGYLAMGGADRGEYVVTLLPPSLLEFRRKGCRRRFTVTLQSCYCLAARIEAEQLRKRRIEERKARAIQGRAQR